MKSLLCILLAAAGFVSAGGADGNRWMSRLDEGRSLGSLAIPGSHNAAARFEPVRGTAKCQDLTVPEQLAAGVRVLDIRCRNVSDRFRIHHGPVDQRIDFATVMDECLAFLARNPRETIVVIIQEASLPVGSTRGFAATFVAEIAPHRGRWWLHPRVPRLGEARGRLVLLRRFPVERPPLGIDATAWTDFRRATDETALRVQDRFRVADNDAKWRLFLHAFRSSRDRPRDSLFLNHASGYRPGPLGIPDIPAVSDDLNRRLKRHLGQHPSPRYGIVMMDFVDPRLAESVFRMNGK